MACLTDGVLRAQLDGELSEAELADVEQHRASCAQCRGRGEAIAADAARVRSFLSALAPQKQDGTLDTRAPIARFRARRAALGAQRPSLAAEFFAKPWGLATWGLAGACLVIALLTFAPARSWAQRFAAMLRVQKITAVPIDFEALGNPSERRRLGKTFAQLLSDDVVMTVKPGEPQVMASREQAAEAAGFTIRLLGKRPDSPRLTMLGEQSFHATIDRDRLQSIIEEAGRSDLQLPYALDGATIAAHIPKIVIAEYGACAHPREGARSEAPASGSDCLHFLQAPSPTVSVPAELNLSKLAEVALQLGGMSAEAARGFSQSVDWGSTVVLGIPIGSSYRTVDVEGVQATLIERTGHGERGRRGYSLLWVKNGTVYALFGAGDSADALTLAESLN
jgi:hypothetical protein